MLRVLRVRPKHAQPTDLLAQPRLHLDLRACLREDTLPELLPALRRVTEHSDLSTSRARIVIYLRTLLECASVCTENHRAGVRGEEAWEGVRERELPLLVEEMEEGGRVDS